MNMNVPNSLTILRILLIPVYVGLLNYEQFDYALATLFIAGLTDALDGTIARVANQRTRLGEVLDPLADKLLLTTGFITLSVMHLVPLWITILVVSRDLMLMLGAAVAHFTNTQVDISPTALGKCTTLIQLTTLVAVVFFASRRMDLAVLDPLLYVMASSRCCPVCIISLEAIATSPRVRPNRHRLTAPPLTASRPVLFSCNRLTVFGSSYRLRS